MVDFAMKAALIDYDQLDARLGFLSQQTLPLILELHTFGQRDIETPSGRVQSLQNLERLRDAYGSVSLTLHIPPQSVRKVTTQMFDAEQIENSLDFAKTSGATRVVVHRYWGMVHGFNPPRSQRDDATAGFNEEIVRLARLADGMTLLVENMGHYFLASRQTDDFLAGPIDHFFPWEIRAFRKFLADNGVNNVFPFVDVAHATLSSNLFNHARHNRELVKNDVRYSGIVESDLDQAPHLHPFDFIDSEMPWLHVSDSVLCDDIQIPSLSSRELTGEGLKLGDGNLPFRDICDHIPPNAPTICVLEVEPAKGDTYANNFAQCASLETLRDIYTRKTVSDRIMQDV